MKTLKYLSMAAVVTLLASCTFIEKYLPIPDKVTVEPESGASVYDMPASDFYIADDSYTLHIDKKANNSDTYDIVLRVKIVREEFDETAFFLQEDPVIVLKDENGEIIEGVELKLGEGALDTKTAGSYAEFIKQTGSAVFPFYLITTDEEVARAASKAVTFQMRNAAVSVDELGSDSDDSDEEYSYSSDDDDDDYSYSSYDDDDNNWDEILDSYERYVNRLVAIAKKAKSGDVSAVMELSEIQGEMEECADKLEDAEGSLTSAQMSRYQRITEKMGKALQ